MDASRLIVLRGNSGSGKSTVARTLVERAGGGLAYLEQDYVRRTVLGTHRFNPADTDHTRDVIDLLTTMTDHLLARGYDVVLDGILSRQRYGGLLRRLAAQVPNHWFYYFDLPFEETVRRHATRATANEFGEPELRQWWKDGDFLGIAREWPIAAAVSAEDAVSAIAGRAGIALSAGNPASAAR